MEVASGPFQNLLLLERGPKSEPEGLRGEDEPVLWGTPGVFHMGRDGFRKDF